MTTNNGTVTLDDWKEAIESGCPLVHFSGGNRKTGTMTVTRSQSHTCPPACGMFYDCYEKFHHAARYWKRLDAGQGKNVHAWDDACRKVRRLAPGSLWRHNEGGDLPGIGNEINAEALGKLVKANKGKAGFTYTHKPVFAGLYVVTGNASQRHESTVSEETAQANRQAIQAANEAGFAVNLSADNLSDADRKAALGIAPVTVTLPTDAEDGVRYTTPEGRKITTCPAALKRNKGKGVDCAMCGLCQRINRSVLIGFPAHGSAKKRASEKARG